MRRPTGADIPEFPELAWLVRFSSIRYTSAKLMLQIKGGCHPFHRPAHSLPAFKLLAVGHRDEEPLAAMQARDMLEQSGRNPFPLMIFADDKECDIGESME